MLAKVQDTIVTCPCGARLRPKPGKPSVVCPRCQTRSPVPRAAVGRIALTCDCGARLGAPADTTATTIRCPRCRARTVLPVIELEYMYDEEDTGEAYDLAAPPPTPQPTRVLPKKPDQTCPSCEQTLPGEDRICVDCGIELATGRSILTHDDTNLNEKYMIAEPLIWTLSWLIWFGIYPIASGAFGVRTPWVVRGLAVLTILASIWFWSASAGPGADPGLRGLLAWNYVPAEEAGNFTVNNVQLLTHQFLHADLFHLLGNLLFLLILGTRVNALIGNVLTAVCYPLLGVLAALIELEMAGDQPVGLLGASGAIAGLAGMYVVLFPMHPVHVASWLRNPFRPWRFAMNIGETRGYVIVVFFLLFDLIYILLGADTGVAHWAHAGGFLAGAGLAMVLLMLRLVNARGGDLLSVLFGRHAWALLGKPNRPGLTLW